MDMSKANVWYVRKIEDGVSAVKLDNKQIRKEQEERETQERHKRLELYLLALVGLSVLFGVCVALDIVNIDVLLDIICNDVLG